MSPKKIFKWSSHNPVIMAVQDLLQPRFIIELGVGNFSTPLLINRSAKKILHVENDKEWLDQIAINHGNDPASEFIHHGLPSSITKSTLCKDLPGYVIDQCQSYYQSLADRSRSISLGPKLLFVDHFASIRTQAINQLAVGFDFVIYHDAESPEEYDYQSIDSAFDQIFDRYVLRTRSSWTGFFCKHGLLEAHYLIDAILDKADQFGQKFGLCRNDFAVDKI